MKFIEVPCPMCRRNDPMKYCNTCSGSGVVEVPASRREQYFWSAMVLIFLAGMLFLLMGMK